MGRAVTVCEAFLLLLLFVFPSRKEAVFPLGRPAYIPPI